MTYVIYDKESTAIVGGSGKSYKTIGAAKAAVSRMRNKISVSDAGSPHDPLFKYGIAEINYFHQFIEHTVERVNIMTGKSFRERMNTPYHCSPSSESYWSN
jgi:hypothetical protein